MHCHNCYVSCHDFKKLEHTVNGIANKLNTLADTVTNLHAKLNQTNSNVSALQQNIANFNVVIDQLSSLHLNSVTINQNLTNFKNDIQTQMATVIDSTVLLTQNDIISNITNQLNTVSSQISTAKISQPVSTPVPSGARSAFLDTTLQSELQPIDEQPDVIIPQPSRITPITLPTFTKPTLPTDTSLQVAFNNALTITNMQNHLNQMLIDTINNNIGNKSNQSTHLVFTDPEKIFNYTISKDTFIFITMIGGGGSGGYGYVKDIYFYSGGGGGSGSSLINKPLFVPAGTQLTIKVGAGGTFVKSKSRGMLSTETIVNNGGTSLVSVNFPDGTSLNIETEGGMNGHPYDINDTTVDGGFGGKSSYHALFDGNSGHNGNIALPSHIVSSPGNGSTSHLHPISNGANNLFCTNINLNGNFGTGGCGCEPFSEPGIGGNGIVMIDIADTLFN